MLLTSALPTEESEDSDEDAVEEDFTPSPRTNRSRSKRPCSWPEIDRKDITKVTKRMLTYLVS